MLLSHLHSKEVFSHAQKEFLVFQTVFIASCLVPESLKRAWKMLFVQILSSALLEDVTFAFSFLGNFSDCSIIHLDLFRAPAIFPQIPAHKHGLY